MENHNLLNGKTHYKCQFSVALLHSQRVTRDSPNLLCSMANPGNKHKEFPKHCRAWMLTFNHPRLPWTSAARMTCSGAFDRRTSPFPKAWAARRERLRMPLWFTTSTPATGHQFVGVRCCLNMCWVRASCKWRQCATPIRSLNLPCPNANRSSSPSEGLQAPISLGINRLWQMACALSWLPSGN